MALVSDLRAMREVHKLFRRLSPHIVHTHNPKPGVYGRLAARLARVPVIVNTVHGLYAQPDDRWLKRFVVYGLERLAATSSHAELVQSVEDIETLRKLRISADRLVVLGNGIDLTRSGPDPAARSRVRSELGVHDDDVVIGAVRRLVREKGYPELLSASRAVMAHVPNARFVMIGPHDPAKADALSPTAINDAEAAGVRFLGHRNDVEDLYRAMDIYVLASHREGFPRSAMEAAASGLPLVLTDIRGCRQVVDDGVSGTLVPVNNPAALESAITDLARLPNLRVQMGEAGAAKAATDFDQQSVIDVTLATYERLMG